MEQLHRPAPRNSNSSSDGAGHHGRTAPTGTPPEDGDGDGGGQEAGPGVVTPTAANPPPLPAVTSAFASYLLTPPAHRGKIGLNPNANPFTPGSMGSASSSFLGSAFAAPFGAAFPSSQGFPFGPSTSPAASTTKVPTPVSARLSAADCSQVAAPPPAGDLHELGMHAEMKSETGSGSGRHSGVHYTAGFPAHPACVADGASFSAPSCDDGEGTEDIHEYDDDDIDEFEDKHDLADSQGDDDDDPGLDDDEINWLEEMCKPRDNPANYFFGDGLRK